MRRTVLSWGLALVAAVALGVGGAGARALDTGTLVVQVLGDGSVTANGGQIDCGQGGTLCRFSTSTVASITLTASSAVGVAWSGPDCFGSTPTCTVSLASGAAREEIATFTPPTLVTNTLTVNVTGAQDNGGTVSGGQIDCDEVDATCTWETYTGSTVTLVEQPDPGYDFSGWGGACSGFGVSCTVPLNSDQTINAAFVKSPTTRTLTVSVAGNGTVSGGGIACTAAGGTGCTAGEQSGEQVVLTATAGAGVGFASWGGACAGSLTTCTVTMSGDQNVSATFTGAGSTTPASFPLTVTVAGGGTVTGGGVSCGTGGSACSQNEDSGSVVTLSADPDPGASLTGWEGACSGTASTCTVTMSSAKNVTATFSGASSAEVSLTVSVSGRGTVTGGGVKCGSGAKTCSVKQKQGSTVGLTASAAAGARFSGWSGACSGVLPTCTVELNGATTVSAQFGSAPGTGAAGAAGLRSRGRPVVTRTATGFAVSLRFRTAQRGPVRVRALRAGRLEAALSFTAPAGPALVAPFALAKPGFYTFELTQARRTLQWHACLGRCGEAAARTAGPFVLTRTTPTVVDADALWSVTLHFRSTQAAGVDLRIFRGKHLAREVRFAARKGAQDAGPLLLSPGNYTLRLGATDAYGRGGALTWVAFLP